MPDYENRTRQGLDAALRALLRDRPLDQLRVRELTEHCGLRRQSFYYHFKDVYDLFAWSVQRERALLLERWEECLTWQQALLDLMDRAARERAFYRAVLDREGSAGLRGMIPLDRTLEAVRRYYRDRAGMLPDPATEERERRRDGTVLLALLESWIRGGLALTAEELVNALEQTVARSTAGTVWQTLRERGEWNWTAEGPF